MRDAEVAALLDSAAPLVVVEAPAGCGKTFQGAGYARRVAARLGRGRVLILTHTHSACAQFAKETTSLASRVELRTIDSLVVQIARIYHKSLGLPPDPAAWVRQQGGNGFEQLGSRVAQLLKCKRMVSAALAERYPIVIADEHQDSREEQHDVVMSLHHAGSQLRVFADPMQRIYARTKSAMAAHRVRWDALKAEGMFGELTHPHRWRDGSPELGAWVLAAREHLQAGESIQLTGKLPHGLAVLNAENIAPSNKGYRLCGNDRRPIDHILDSSDQMLVLSGQKAIVDALRAFWNRKFPVWEGHMREPLGKMVTALNADAGNPTAVGEAMVAFIGEVCVGFSRSSHGDRFASEIASACLNRTSGKPAHLQALARCILAEPNHVGIALCLRELAELVELRTEGFEKVFVDYRNEYRDAIRLGEFADAEEGFSELNRRRSFARPMPPLKAISTIHKAKGLECDNALLIPCDKHQFSDTEYARCKLYVALSRAKRSLTLVVPRTSASPLFEI